MLLLQNARYGYFTMTGGLTMDFEEMYERYKRREDNIS